MVNSYASKLISSSGHQDIGTWKHHWWRSWWRGRGQRMMSEVIDLERVVSAGRKGSRWSELTLLHPRTNTQDKDHFLRPLSFIWSRIYTQTLFYLNSCVETLQENCRGVESFFKTGRKKLIIELGLATVTSQVRRMINGLRATPQWSPPDCH